MECRYPPSANSKGLGQNIPGKEEGLDINFKSYRASGFQWVGFIWWVLFICR